MPPAQWCGKISLKDALLPPYTMHEQIPAPAAAATGEQTRPLRILVADDEPGLRLAISLFLRRRGHDVVEAADAHEARRLTAEQSFDVALIDARMPGDGLRLLQELDASVGLGGRTALMTGDPGRGLDTAELTGGRPFLSKPFDLHAAAALLEGLGG